MTTRTMSKKVPVNMRAETVLGGACEDGCGREADVCCVQCVKLYCNQCSNKKHSDRRYQAHRLKKVDRKSMPTRSTASRGASSSPSRGASSRSTGGSSARTARTVSTRPQGGSIKDVGGTKGKNYACGNKCGRSAQLFCTQCSLVLCSTCSRTIHAKPAFKSHDRKILPAVASKMAAAKRAQSGQSGRRPIAPSGSSSIIDNSQQGKPVLTGGQSTYKTWGQGFSERKIPRTDDMSGRTPVFQQTQQLKSGRKPGLGGAATTKGTDHFSHLPKYDTAPKQTGLKVPVTQKASKKKEKKKKQKKQKSNLSEYDVLQTGAQYVVTGDMDDNDWDGHREGYGVEWKFNAGSKWGTQD